MRWWRLFRHEDREREIDREIESHLELEVEDQRESGVPHDEARYAARKMLGNVTRVKEDTRATWDWAWLETIWQDLRYAMRMLRKNPAFTAAVVLTLALGIGANTAIFSVCNAVLLKPLPYSNPDRIVMLWEQQKGELGPVAPANFVDWREQARSFREVAAIQFPNFILTGKGEPARLRGAAVSASFFSLFGIRFTLGRNFLEEEDQPGRDHVVILSYRTWRERFGAQPDIAGKPVTLNDTSYTVVGVLPPDFQFASKASDFQAQNQFDVWVPLALKLGKHSRGTHPLRVFARLKPGVALSQAQADLNVVAANLARLYPENNREKGITAVPLGEQITTNVQPALAALLGAVGLLLLIACANVANLLLSRAAVRQKELAVRLALGANRRRLAQQLLTESVLLASLGGIGGFFFALAVISALLSRLPADLSRASGIAVDVPMLVFTGLISLSTGFLFGLAPLFQARKVSANESLKQNARVAGGRQSHMRNSLVIAQISIAMVLLIGAGLMAKSFWNLLQVSPGFRTEHILTARVTLPASRYPDAWRIAAFQRELLEHLQNTPGVQSAGLTAYLPFSGTDNAWAFRIEGRPPLPVGVYNMTKYRPVSPAYFETIGIPLLHGRGFTLADNEDAPLVVVINESMARTYWDQQNPVGQRLRFGGETWRTIVGVVGDVRHESLDGETKPEMYVPFTQIPGREDRPTIVVRTTIGPAAMTATLRKTVYGIDAALPLDQVETMEQLVSASVGQPRFRTVLLALFSILALVIASIGIYGVMNYLVIQRTQEFGIRMAIGATGGDVLWLVLSKAAILIFTGLVLGLLGSVMLTRLIASLLYGVTPLDLVTFIVVSLLLCAIAFLASYLPARRASRVDPMVALRYE